MTSISTPVMGAMMPYGQNPIILSFLNNRKLSHFDVEYLLDPQATHQHDPLLLKGSAHWIARLHSIKGRRIAIIPDYDADGVMSGTVLRVSLSLFGFGDAYMYHPNSYDGYGLTRSSVDNVLEAQPDTQVLITTDNGSNAHDGIAYAKSLGLLVFVTDHHLADTTPPADAIVNPNAHGDTSYPFASISGAAVVYKVMQAYAREYITDANIYRSFESLILLVGVSTVSDMMPLLNENRYFVTKSVAMLAYLVEGHSVERIIAYDDTPLSQYYRGLDLLVMTLNRHGKLKYGIDSDTFGFTIGPMLNSPRRMTGESKLSFDLFQTTKQQIMMSGYEGAEPLPNDALYDMNEARKTYVRALSKKLLTHINSCEKTVPIDHAVFNATMGGGIAGLLSNTYSKEFKLPSIAFAVPMNDMSIQEINVDVSGHTYLSGSARSPEWFDLFKFLTTIDEEYPGLIANWGGHEQAAGIKIKAENYLQFREIFTSKLKQHMSSVQAGAEADLSPIKGEFVIGNEAYNQVHEKSLTSVLIPVPEHSPAVSHPELIESVRFFGRLAPYGQGFAEPTFSVVISMCDVQLFFMGADKSHAKLTLPNGLAVIHWGGADLFRLDTQETTVQDDRIFVVTGSIGINEFRGKETLQIIADDVVQIK